MVTVAEAAASAKTPMGAAAAAGIDTLSLNQTITFTKYVKVVLPLDGFVFWVRADQVSASALANAAAVNAVALNQAPRVVTPAATVLCKGSLHYATVNTQDPDATYSTNQVRFTAEDEVQDLNEVGPMVMLLAEFDGVSFAFSQRGSYYEQSGLHHYIGTAVTSVMRTQIIDDAGSLDQRNVIVSNSLPIWLALNAQMPVYPSYLVPLNEPPPYCAVDIDPLATEALQDFPSRDSMNNQSQLVRDRVRLTLYGTRNFQVQDYLAYLFNYSLATDAFGLMNMPVPRDEKRTQVELGTIAQKKSVELEVSYYQTRARDVARQQITSAIGTVTLGGPAP